MEVSLNPERFWQITPREIEREMKARIKCLYREMNDRAWLAWHIAALSRQKKLPKLSSLQVKEVQVKQRQSQQEITRSLKQMFILFGGDPKELEKFNGS